MTENKTPTPLDVDGLMRKGTHTVLSNLGIFIASLTLLLAVTLFFTDVRLEVRSAVEFTLEFAFLFFACCVMYASMADTGAGRGRETEEYRRAAAEYADAVKQAEERRDTSSLAAFCERVRSRALEKARRRVLATAGIAYEDYLSAMHGKAELPPGLSRRAKRAVREAERMKPPKLSPAMLLSREKEGKGERLLGAAPEKKRAVRGLAALLPAALATCFSVGVVFEWLKDPGAETIIAALCKLFTLVWNGAKGYRSGFCNAAGDAATYNAARARLLREFLAETT